MTDYRTHVAELESRIAFQEDAIAAINRELATHVQMIQDLEAQLRHLNRKADELHAAASAAAAQSGELEPPPPHY